MCSGLENGPAKPRFRFGGVFVSPPFLALVFLEFTVFSDSPISGDASQQRRKTYPTRWAGRTRPQTRCPFFFWPWPEACLGQTEEMGLCQFFGGHPAAF